MAVFTLPSEMIKVYKRNIEYISEHAVDPDMRRYATRHEAVRHYIDLDHWGTYPYENVPRRWLDMLIQYTEIYCITGAKDTVRISEAGEFGMQVAGTVVPDSVYRNFFARHIMPQYYEEEWSLSCPLLRDSLGIADCPECVTVFATEGFSEYGILPYHLVFMQQQLTAAFANKNISKILSLSADMGHYIGDAHVPLHTTENYNGQLSGQNGIHAFWESRIPELLAEQDFDFLVGQADYIENPVDYYWKIVLHTHQHVEDVLSIEKELSLTYPSDQQFCFEERLDRMIRTQCSAYAIAYHERMNGMVEEQMRRSIQAIGSAWYTAWVDAGQPDIYNDGPYMSADTQYVELKRAFQSGKIIGREH